MKLCIKNLPFSVTEPQLRELFEEVGEVSKASIITDRETGRSRGFGFVEMPNSTHANEAMNRLNGYEMAGREISVEEARERPQEQRGWKTR